MNILIAMLALISFAFAEVPYPRAATGLELGVARLSGKGESVIGTSWMYHFESQPDKYVTFFGQAGNSTGKEGDVRISQTSFGGGAEFDVLPVLGLRVGVATAIAEVEKNGVKDKEQEFGPFAGLAMNVTSGVFKFGTTATVMRTETVRSLALRGFVFIEF